MWSSLLTGCREIVKAQSHHPFFMVEKTVLPLGP